ncbi:MAG: hypothetical protein AAF581_17330 [Planctomycetota bacterium]
MLPSLCSALVLLTLTQPGPAAAAPTYHDDIAPLIAQHCLSCHVPGGGAPFPLLTYRDVRRRGRQIVEVTASGFMPPWLPKRGNELWRNARKLSSTELRTLHDWVAQGRKRGTPRGNEPTAITTDWRLGKPDLVVTTDAPFTVPSEGLGLLRTVVLPVPTVSTESRPTITGIRAVELLATNPAALHGALFLADDTDLARALDAATPETGYPSMGSIGLNVIGSLGGWNIGSPMQPWPAGYAWPLTAGTLSAQLHLNPTGKEEEVGISLGLHYATDPDLLPITSVVLSSLTLDIPAGANAYETGAHYETPVDLHLLGMTPLAHLVCTTMQVTLQLPDGTSRSLLQIDDWDMNWQQPYQYEQPQLIPKGSRITTKYRYDNSDGNPRNPYSPPRPVKPGQAPRGEVAILVLYVAPTDASQLPTIEASNHANFRRALEERQR